MSAQTMAVSPTSLSFFHQIGQPSPAQQNVNVTATTQVAVTVGASVTGGGNWLLVNPTGGTTPFSLAVIVVPGSLGPGVYTGSITFTSAGVNNSPITIPVTMTVSNSPLLVPTPASLQFSFSLGGPAPPAQNVNLGSTTAGVAYTAAASTSSGGSWLGVNPGSGSTPTALNITVNPSGVPVGTHSGTITVAAAAAGNSPLSIPVTFTVADEIRLNLNPATLNFDFQAGGAPPQDRVVSITSTGGPVNYSATATATGGWLSITGTSGVTPANLTVSVNPAGLPAGVHNGTITVTAPGATNSPQTVAITLRVSTNPLLTALPASVPFTAQTGGTGVPRQVVALSNFGNPIAFTMDVATTSGGPWLNAFPAAGTTPASISIGVTPGSLLPGIYEGAITITGSAGNSPFRIPVNLIITARAGLRTSVNHLNYFFQTGGSNPAPRTVTISTTSPGVALNYTATASTAGGGAWLSVTPVSGTAQSDLTVSVNPANLVPGLYSGTVEVVSTEAGSTPLSIPVQLLISNAPMLVVPAGPLQFLFAVGGQPPANQQLQVASTGAALNFTVASSTSTANNWLRFAPASGTSGSAVTIGADPFGLAEGTFTGLVTITAAGAANSPQHVPVNFRVTTATELVVGPAPIVFDQILGGEPVAPRVLNVTSTGTILAFTVRADTLSGGRWLTAEPTAGLTPGTITVRANTTGLEPGTYSGSITIESTGAVNSPRIVPVTLNVTRARPLLNISRDTLTFHASTSGQAPATQTVQVTSSGDPLSITTSVSGGSWLTVSSSSGTTPATLTVAVNAAGLAPGNYTAELRVSSTGASNSPRVITVNLTVVPLSAPTITAIVNAASFQPTAAVPGLIVTLFGTGIGPATPATLQLTAQGRVATTLGETRILFDDIPSPLIAVSSGQSSAVVPYGIDGRTNVRVQVEFRGVRSEARELRVTGSSPGIFAADASGRGQGAILNQDTTVNSAFNPAERGSVIVVYATGEGQTRPGGEDGTITGATLKRPELPVRATIGGREAVVEYAGSAPGLVSGVIQLNLRVPADVTPGPSVTLEITIGAATSQFGITVAVR